MEDYSSLAQITNEGHGCLSRYYKYENPEDLKRAIACLEQALLACPPAHQCRAVALFNLATARLISCQVGITSPDFDIPITLYRDALDLRPVGHPDRPATQLHLARATMSRFLKWGEKTYAEEAKKLIAQVQDVCSVDSYEYQLADTILRECTPDIATNERTDASCPSNLPTSTAEYEVKILHAPNHHPAYSPTSIPDTEAAILRTPGYHPRKSSMLEPLAFTPLGHFEAFNHMGDIDGSIMAVEKAMELVQESDPEWPQRALNFGILAGRRFHLSKNTEDLERSISVLDKAVKRMPVCHADRSLALVILGTVLSERFGQLGQIADSDRTISAQEEALQLVQDDHSSRPIFLFLLGAALLQRYQHLHDPVDLDKSISLMKEAAQYPSPDHVGVDHLGQTGDAADHYRAVFTRSEALKVLRHRRLLYLGSAFQLRSLHLNDLGDLDKAISVTEEALNFTPRNHRDRPLCLSQLGYTFLLRYDHLGNLADLHNSTSLLAEAVRLTPDDCPHRSELLVQFGLSLIKRFERFGNIIDIDKSIAVGEEAVERAPNHRPSKPSWLFSLGVSLITRFGRLGNPADLDKSSSMMEEAVRLTPVDDQDRPRRLIHLGEAFRTRFERQGDLSDLNKSISALEEATHLKPNGHSIKCAALTALAHAMMTRAEHLGDVADHDRSILLGEKAVQLTQDGDPHLPTRLSNVATSLMKRYSRRGDVTDADKSTSLMEKALHLIPEDHPSRPAMLLNTGSIFGWRAKTQGNLPALHTAILYFSCAARSRASGQPLTQFQAFKSWFYCAVALHRISGPEAHQILLEAFECGISLIPQLAWIGLPFKDRYMALLEAADIIQSAASVATGLGHSTRAIEWLEQGRCIVWGQLLQLRTPLDQLRYADPDLANRLEWLSNSLEHSGAASEQSFGEQNGRGELLEQRARRHRELVTERETLLEQVQALPGFEQFFLPKTFSQLRASAHLGPIIILSVNPKQGDALIVVADLDEPVHVPLLLINEAKAEDLRMLLNNVLSNDGRVVSRDDPIRAARPVGQEGRSFGRILADLWIKVVKPVLHALALSVSKHRSFISTSLTVYTQTPGKLTRIFWCPTGTLSFLPIHAAGNYDVPGPGNKASDFIISSYIPTLSVLAPSHEKTALSNVINLLVVPQPSSDGQTHLPGVRDETMNIRTTVETLSSTRVHLRESNGDVEGVLDEMKRSNWVHFACHGVQDVESPTDSGLCLADQRRLRLSDIIRLSRPRGGLAFLSACQTATGAVELSEEAVHLSAGMLFAGYSSVIGTMWSIKDSVAPRLAQDVYEQLFRDGRTPDSREAARALHNAVERLSQSGQPFIAWVPFVHMGV